MAITEGAQIRQMPPHVEPNLVVLRHIVSAFVRGGRFARNGVHWSDVMEGHHDDELRPALPHLAMLLDVLAGARDAMDSAADRVQARDFHNADWTADQLRCHANYVRHLLAQFRPPEVITVSREEALEMWPPASGMEAATAGETAKTGSTEGDSPVAKPDAQTPSGDH
jgi:hypothetical protein